MEVNTNSGNETPLKGVYGGLCNLTRCKTGLPATWYNYGTRLYYCAECAGELNADPFNQRDAQRLYGHELCKEGEHGR